MIEMTLILVVAVLGALLLVLGAHVRALRGEVRTITDRDRAARSVLRILAARDRAARSVPVPDSRDVRRCRECQCTDDSIVYSGSWWAEGDLCSSCADDRAAGSSLEERV